MGSGARLRSDNEAFGRSKTGTAFLITAEPVVVESGHLIVLGADEGPIAIDPGSGAYRVLGINLPDCERVCFAGGALYGYRPNDLQVYVYDPVGDQWNAQGAPRPLSPIRDIVSHNDVAHVAAGSTAFYWTGAAWAELLRYDATQIRNGQPSFDVFCTDFPVATCDDLRSVITISNASAPSYNGTWDVEAAGTNFLDIRVPFAGTATGDWASDDGYFGSFTSVTDQPGELIRLVPTGNPQWNLAGPQLHAMVSQNGHLYLAGYGWEHVDSTNFDHLNAHPILDESGNVIAILRRPVDYLVNGHTTAGDSFFFFRQDNPTIQWRDTYPGCCLRFEPQPDPDDHFTWISSSAAGYWGACKAVTAFASDNIDNPFEVAGDQPDIRWLIAAGATIYASIRHFSGVLRMTTEADHGYTGGESFEADSDSRYAGTWFVGTVESARIFTVDYAQFRGDQRFGIWNGFPTGDPDNYVAAVSRASGEFSGLFRWTGTGWVDYAQDRNWPEGLPDAHPLITTGGPGWFAADNNGPYGLAINESNVIFALTEDADAGSLEVITGGLFVRQCVPAQTFPILANNAAKAIIALQRGAVIPGLDQSCPGNLVTTSGSANANTILLTTSPPHGLTGADSIEIITSTVSGYLGVKQIAEIVDANTIRARDTFEGNASGTWAAVGDPDNNGVFSAVADGGVWTYWFTYLELGRDVRPSDLILRGATSGLSVDFGGVPSDYRKREIIPGGLRGQHEPRYNRFGQTDGPGTSHFYRLEYPQATDPGWIIDEQVLLSLI